MDADKFDAILADVASGEAVRNSLAEKSISPKTFYAHLAKNAEAGERYARARESGLAKMADDITEISDREDLDPNDKRVRIDSRKWLLSKLIPRTYGDRVDHTHGGDPNRPIQNKVTVEFVSTGAGSVPVPVAATS